jgi:hypothetical protein
LNDFTGAPKNGLLVAKPDAVIVKSLWSDLTGSQRVIASHRNI